MHVLKVLKYNLKTKFKRPKVISLSSIAGCTVKKLRTLFKIIIEKDDNTISATSK